MIYAFDDAPDLPAEKAIDFYNSVHDPRFRAPERAALARFQITAALGVGLVKDGALKAILAVHNAAPRAWTAGEAALLGEVAERTWAAVERAQPLLVLEAMKMEHTIKAPRAGTVAGLRYGVGEQVEDGALLVTFADDEAPA